MSKSITAQELMQWITAGEPHFVLDVRNPDEYARFHIAGHLIPLSVLDERLDEIPRDVPIVVHCHAGVRSRHAQDFLLSAGFSEVYNLTGGILAWQQEKFPGK